jgi:hypothetical protein
MKRLYLLIMFYIFTGCRPDPKADNIKVFYYHFEGFSATNTCSSLLYDMSQTYASYDYVINTKEILQAVPRSLKFKTDTLESYHRYIHRIELNPDSLFNTGDIKYIIACTPGTDGWPAEITIKRYTFTSGKKWRLQYDLGTHRLEGYPSDSVKRVRFITDEIARASFK